VHDRAKRARAVAAGLLLLPLCVARPAPADSGARVREPTYRALARAERAIEEERYAKALRILDALAPRADEVSLERALVAQARASVLLARERYAEAVPALEAALGAGALPDVATANLRQNLLQVDLVLGEPERLLRRIGEWFGEPPSALPPELGALAGRGHFELERFAPAAERLREAIAAEPDGPTWWYELLLACNYELERYDEALRILRTLVEREPSRRRYWIELARVAAEREDYRLAVSALELAEDLRPLDETHLVLLARLNLLVDAPARAARLLVAALGSGRVAESAVHLELLADAWTLAREHTKASEALARAAELAPKQRWQLLLRRGELLLELGRTNEARVDLAVAAGADDEKIAGRAGLLLGVAHYRAGHFEASLAALGKAERVASVRDQARRWASVVRARAAHAEGDG